MQYWRRQIRQHCIGYSSEKTCLGALGQHCTSKFLVQCYLRLIWTVLTIQYFYAMLSQDGQYNQGIIIQTGKKVIYKSLLNSAWLSSRAQLAIKKKQEYFSLPDHQLAEYVILVFGL